MRLIFTTYGYLQRNSVTSYTYVLDEKASSATAQGFNIHLFINITR